MTDEEIRKKPCDACGGPCKVTFHGYSCPAVYRLKCETCGHEMTRFGEGIKVLDMTVEEHAAYRPKMYINCDDPKLRAIAERTLKAIEEGGK